LTTEEEPKVPVLESRENRLEGRGEHDPKV
jgi:hypothetical protein